MKTKNEFPIQVAGLGFCLITFIVLLIAAPHFGVQKAQADPIVVPPGVAQYYGSALGLTLSGNVTNKSLLGTPTFTNLVTDAKGWGSTNGTAVRQLVTINFDLTPAAAAQACVDIFWTNSAGVVSNRFSTGVGLVAQSISCTGILESNGVVQVVTNRLNGATTVQALINVSSTPFP